MRCFSGKSVYQGIVSGPVAVLNKKAMQVERKTADDAQQELERLQTACRKTKEQLGRLYQKARKEAGEDSAAIFEVHQMLLEDEDYLEEIHRRICEEQINAEYAVSSAGDYFYQMFDAMEDEYMKARAADIRDISDRVVRNLAGIEEAAQDWAQPSILVADDLTPSETVRMDKDKILAFVTVHGSANSHTAILARTMNIPALIGVPLDLQTIRTGMTAVVDGFEGKIIFDPDEAAVSDAVRRMDEEQEKRRLLEQLIGKDNVTRSGRRIEIYANAGSIGDIEAAMENDAGGIGLFRSEFLYLGRNEFPSEEEQYEAYRNAVQKMNGRKVIIRTLDLGADKQADYFRLGQEENPAMGYRAIRICLEQPDIFRTQLRALLRVASCGNLSIMYPMIISSKEAREIRRIVAEVGEELKRAGIPYRIPEQGIMIETPAAVMVSDELAELSDFFSIGTNDLTQYTLAIDRQNPRLDRFYDPHHPAILKMIRLTVESAHRHGKWVGICGELAADETLTETFIRMGVDELSVAPPSVLKLRKIVRDLDV